MIVGRRRSGSRAKPNAIWIQPNSTLPTLHEPSARFPDESGDRSRLNPLNAILRRFEMNPNPASG